MAENIQRRARLAEIHYETERFKQMAETASQHADHMTLTSRLDPLTGIGNRRQLDLTMSEIRTTGADFAVAILDLDYFKGINDRYSHMVGDEVLKRVAGVLRLATSQHDLVVRLGGEEFAVVMRDIDLPNAMVRCNDFRTKVAEADWKEIAPGLCVTTSISVAVWDRMSDLAGVLALADHRLYVAKASGRNRVVGDLTSLTPIAAHVADLVRPQLASPPGMASGNGMTTAQPHLAKGPPDRCSAKPGQIAPLRQVDPLCEARTPSCRCPPSALMRQTEVSRRGRVSGAS